MTPEENSTAGRDDRRFVSVTSILGVIDKPALVHWAANMTAQAAISTQGTWRHMLDEQGEAETAKWLAGARFRTKKRRSAAETGTAVHQAAQEWVLTGRRPDVDDDLAPYLDQLGRWLERHQPTYEAAELTVFSPTYGFAGTADAILRLDDVPLIIDYKTTDKETDGRGQTTAPYAEAALQLAAYRHADIAAVWRVRRNKTSGRRYYLLSPEEAQQAVAVPEVQGGLVIHITPGHCHAHIVECGDATFDAFLHLLEVARWVWGDGRYAIGAPLASADGTV